MSEKRTTKRSAKRIPIGQRNQFNTEKRPGYVRRFVTDKPGRIQAFLDAGYDLVKDDSEHRVLFGSKEQKNDGEGSVVVKNLGDGTKGYLMEIPENFYREDQLAKEKHICGTEASVLQDTQGHKEIYGQGVTIGNGRSVESENGRPTVTTI